MSAQPVLMPASLLVVVPTLNSHALLARLLLLIDGPSGPEHRRWLDQCSAAEPRCSAPPRRTSPPSSAPAIGSISKSTHKIRIFDSPRILLAISRRLQ